MIKNVLEWGKKPMQATILKSFNLSVCPEMMFERLFSKVEVLCPEVKKKVGASRRDPYDITVDFISVSDFPQLNVAMMVAENFGRRRFLTPHELLSLNLWDSGIRRRWPIFTNSCVLEYIFTGATTDDENEDPQAWRIGLAAHHLGKVIDSDALFATTVLTVVDEGLWTTEYLANLEAVSPAVHH